MIPSTVGGNIGGSTAGVVDMRGIGSPPGVFHTCSKRCGCNDLVRWLGGSIVGGILRGLLGIMCFEPVRDSTSEFELGLCGRGGNRTVVLLESDGNVGSEGVSVGVESENGTAVMPNPTIPTSLSTQDRLDVED